MRLVGLRIRAPSKVFATTGIASVGLITVHVTGSGFAAGEAVDLVLEPGPGPDVVLGSGDASGTGAIDLSLSRLSSTGAAAANAKNLALKGRVSGTVVTFSPAPNPFPFSWDLLFSRSGTFPGHSGISDTELAPAGFALGSISISSVTPNIDLLSQQ